MRSLKWLIQFSYILFSLVLSCGEDPYTRGIELYNSGKYDASVKLFLTVQDKYNDNPEFLEIFALAYMNKGQVLFNKTKNAKAFLGNYEKGQKIMPKNPSAEFNQKHSEILFSLANAFLKAKESNSREKDIFYSGAIKYLQISISLDSTNADSRQLLAQLKEKDFRNLLDKAEKQYTKANRTGNINLYFSAKSNLQKAILFNSDDKKVRSLKTRLRKKMLGILDDQDGLAIAITNSMRKKDLLTLKIAVKNYLNVSST